MDHLPTDSVHKSHHQLIIPCPMLSYLFLPYIWRRSVRAGHVQHLSGGKRSSKWQRVECKWCKCLYPSMFHISCTKLHIKYGEGMLGYCPIPSSFNPSLHNCSSYV